MTEKQLDALEAWIVAIIQREDRASDLHDIIRCVAARAMLEAQIGIAENDYD